MLLAHFQALLGQRAAKELHSRHCSTAGQDNHPVWKNLIMYTSDVTPPHCERMGLCLDHFQIRDNHFCWLWSYSCGHEHCRLNFKGTSLSLFWEHQRQTEMRFLRDGEDRGSYRWQPMSDIYPISKGLLCIFGLESRCLSTQANVLAQFEMWIVYFVIDFCHRLLMARI